jgi:hypothetical protein
VYITLVDLEVAIGRVGAGSDLEDQNLVKVKSGRVNL